MASKGRYITRGPWTRVLEKLGADKGLKLKGKSERGLSDSEPEKWCREAIILATFGTLFPTRLGYNPRTLNMLSGLLAWCHMLTIPH